MSFTIDGEKVKELMATRTLGGYVVSASSLEIKTEEFRGDLCSTTEVSGTDYANFSAALGETRKQLMAIRKRIEESGRPLHNIDALTKEIEEGRSR